jgi:hypothetical protein
MDDTRALAALDVVLNMGINDSVGRLGRAEATLVEAREMCPVLFATVGQVFEHPLKLGDDRAVFRYKGRTTRGGSATCSEETCGSSNCGEGPHLTPPNWLIFSSWGTHVKGSGVDESEQVTYNESEPGVCQDVRDLIEAWPKHKYYVYAGEEIYCPVGSTVHVPFDPALICLPPSMCYCFREVEADWGTKCDKCFTKGHAELKFCGKCLDVCPACFESREHEWDEGLDLWTC